MIFLVICMIMYYTADVGTPNYYMAFAMVLTATIVWRIDRLYDLLKDRL